MCAPLLTFLALLAPLSQASEPRSRIRHAEPAGMPATLPSGSARVAVSDAPARLTFEAYGRRFELELESNERLLLRLPAARRAELPPHDLYRGRLTGLPGSWVRLSRLSDGMYGAIWDGSEFYSIAPAHALAEFMSGVAPPTSDQPLIYRASDVESPGGPATCTVVDPAGGSGLAINGLEQYKSLRRELPRLAASATAVARLELEVAMIADQEFSSLEVDPVSALLNRLNVVDGIFSEQVGVAITATEVAVFDDSSDPFTTSNAQALLDQVGRYRIATPAIAAAGLAHLVTGRNLTKRDPQNNIDDSIVGIAYLFGVCEKEIGVSVSERLDPFSSALVAAHEFGHNFGAPHDTEQGLPCQSVPQGFLMDPVLNGSTEFSQCSLAQMQPAVEQSTCIRQRRFIDVEPVPPRAVIGGHIRIPIRVGIDVANHGTTASQPVDVALAIPGPFAISPVSVEQGTCTASGNSLTCRLNGLSAGQGRRIEADVTGERAGRFTGEVTTSTADDADPGNDRGTFELSLLTAPDPPGNVVVSGSSPDVRTEVGATFAFPRVVVHASSSTPDVRLTMRIPGSLSIASAVPDAGICEVSLGAIACEFGDLFDETRTVDLSLRANQGGTFTTEIRVTSAEDADLNDSATSIDVIVDSGPVARPSDEGGGGGGGGGSVNWTTLVFAALGLGLRRRRPPTSISHLRQVHSVRCPDGGRLQH
jgi:hypothetical protein